MDILLPEDRVLCRCSKCKKHIYTHNGVSVRGQAVHPDTRRQHLRANLSESEDEGPAQQKTKQERKRGVPKPQDIQDIADDINLDAAFSEISYVSNLFIAWLYISAGVSRDTANLVLRTINFLFSLIVQVFARLLQALNLKVKLPSINLPRDLRTALKSDPRLEPKINRVVCCPSCHTLYPLATAVPTHCRYRPSPRSKPCNTELMMRRRTRHGFKLVPRRLYSTQSFSSWLEFFLGRADIEAAIHASYEHKQSDDWMRGIWDAPAWKSLGDFPFYRGNLVFGLYVDWFNPFTNKIAGKVVSVGLLFLFCLNLPPELRFLPENIVIIGIIPGRDAPDKVTISHILTPFVDIFSEYKVGKNIFTHSHPAPIGEMIKAALIPLVADLQAIRKASGHLSHSATKFCSFCYLLKTDLHRLDYHNFVHRTNDQVRAHAEEWRTCKTVKGRKELASQNGVRWTALYRLGYWKPVDHVVLGFMHNMLEGVLQEHLRNVLGIGRKEAKAKKKGKGKAQATDTSSTSETDGSITEVESDMNLDLEYNNTAQDTSLHGSGDSDTPTNHSQHTMSHTLSTSSQHTITGFSQHMHTGVESIQPNLIVGENDEGGDNMALMEEEDAEEEEDLDQPNTSGFDFPKQHMTVIRNCLRDVALPTHVNRLDPEGLGEKSYGKLKANDYLVLFTTIFPLVLPELWFNTTESPLLDNFYNLVASTNIIASYKTSSSEADQYTHHFIKYRNSLQQLFPAYNEKPNHHYAGHGGEQLKYWGPLPPISEFGGERLNGMLQSLNTNTRIYDLDFTMLRQMCRRGRLDVLLEQPSSNPHMATLSKILDGTNHKDNVSSLRLSTAESADILAKGKPMNEQVLVGILAYLRHWGEAWRHPHDFPHPLEDNPLILPSLALHPTEFRFRGYTFSCVQSHEGNSGIQFSYNHTVYSTGHIHAICQIPLQGILRTFLLVHLHNDLPEGEANKGPYHQFPRFNTKIVDATPSNMFSVIEPKHIITHLTVYKRPAGTYGITKDFLVVCWSLNRGRW